MPAADPVQLDRLGQAIRARRVQLGLSQATAAQFAGIHPNYFGTLERGEVNPTFGTLLHVSRGLDLPLDRLIADALEATEAR
jgi:transcriptional regulator with XRE-family HTH domain